VAFSEKIEKFVPAPSQVAPKGYDFPGKILRPNIVPNFVVSFDLSTDKSVLGSVDQIVWRNPDSPGGRTAEYGATVNRKGITHKACLAIQETSVVALYALLA
jgi:hypothetical protein